MSAPAPEALRQSLAAALAYFDIFDHPLTLSELGRLRYGQGPREPSLEELAVALDDRRFGKRDGYYFLPGRQDTVTVRKRRYRAAEDKYLRAHRLVSLFRFLPSIRLIAVCNSLAMSGADEGSDIDLFVVCRSGTIWTTRLIMAGLLQVLGLRPSSRRQADTFCLSFFVSEDRLDLSRLATGPDDVYLRYWIASLVPIYDAGGVMPRFLEANNWITDLLPGAGPKETGRRRMLPPGPSWTAALLPFLRAAEPSARRLQVRLFPEEISSMANRDTRVVVSDDILKFHVNDRRLHFRDLFRERLAALDPTP